MRKLYKSKEIPLAFALQVIKYARNITLCEPID
jgi:hypothetical protein